jgi:hypothetical protein
MDALKLTDQERKIISYLQPKHGEEVPWEELAQFSKDPQTVKKKTMQKTVSEIKRKYTAANLPMPFSVTFKVIEPEKTKQETIQVQGQTLVKVPRPEKPVVKTPVVTPAVKTVQEEFELDRNTKRVKTRFGYKQLNDSEWDVFKYIHANPGRIIPISELRDKVVFPQYGSKLPARWFDSIMRIINNLRRQVDGLNTRLLTVKSGETSYLFQ